MVIIIDCLFTISKDRTSPTKNAYMICKMVSLIDCPPISCNKWGIPNKKLEIKTDFFIPFENNILSINPRKKISSINATTKNCMINIKNKSDTDVVRPHKEKTP